ncbi:hypothetical protein KP509_22G028000 [Ceratopteris richardii]|uniref:EngB-type G domain-containing protein n=1 Tax=Ceratopteris richardii TaxID=49495 RepID=A0A8T2S4M0_CERRI|nr:hypothetical protein KP509_22G028000 [Ceratopteris richardii]KAH7306747.1 hypothetical protein KP509_22G028000 [Ceratopteris richardii]KAH7306748.1 hypothetical protein KP509_22G028000 [Ceratopteris richardii]
MHRLAGPSGGVLQISKLDKLLPLLWPSLGRYPSHSFRPCLITFPQCNANITSSTKAISKGKVSPLQKPDIITEEPITDLKKSLSGDKAQLNALKDAFVPPTVSPADLPSLRRLQGSNIFVAPNAVDYRVKQSAFVQASTRVSDCPKDGLPEFAFVGRSNVGKSSLINALVQKKEFAETSKKPGKTQVINHYLINKSWYLVDLPGYGFANVPTDIRSTWNTFTKGYFLRSDSLVCVLLLVDASIPPQAIDLDCADWLGRNRVPLTVVFTKCDKTRKKVDGGKLEDNVRGFLRLLKKSYDQMPPWIMTSAVTNNGRDELLQHLYTLRTYWSE